MHATQPTPAPAVAGKLINLFFGTIVFAIGLANLLLVHPVPGVVGLLLSVLYWPWTNGLFQKHFGRPIPLALKVGLGVLVIWFTLGVSDLGDMID